MGIDPKPLHIAITAGEPSGDMLGARLMKAIRAQRGDAVAFSGVGGPLMEREGMRSLFPMTDLAVMGIAEVLPKLGLILSRIAQTAVFIKTAKPDVVVTVDSPDFSFRVAKAVGQRTCPWVHYVAPTVWAWRPERAAKVARLYDGIICLFPFEPPYFTVHGMKAVFAGHPAIESVEDLEGGKCFRVAQGIADDEFVIGVLFGSRSGEVQRVGEILRDAVKLALSHIAAERPVIVAPTLPHLEDRVRALLADMPCPVHVMTDQGAKWRAFAAMDAAVAVSGTVGLELAVSGVPHVIAYRMNPITWAIVRRRVKLDHAHLANILLDDRVVPEFIQDECQPEAIAGALERLFNRNGAAATAQRTAFANVRRQLGGEGTDSPSEQAAGFVLDCVRTIK